MEAARHYTYFMDMGFFIDREMPEVQQLNPQHGGSFRPTVLIGKPLSIRRLDVHSASSKRCCGKPHSDRSDMSADKASDRMQNNRDFYVEPVFVNYILYLSGYEEKEKDKPSFLMICPLWLPNLDLNQGPSD